MDRCNDVMLDNCKIVDNGLWIPRESICQLGQYYMDVFAELGKPKSSYTIKDLYEMTENEEIRNKYKYLFQFVYELYIMYNKLSNQK